MPAAVPKSDEEALMIAAQVAGRLARADGVVGVALGGSRARGEHLTTSDIDLGVYYDSDERGSPLDLDALRGIARDLVGDPVDVSEPGGWGPWVDGGAWLTVDGAAVDWIYRDIGRVETQVERARRGEYAFHSQVGHPLGFLDVSYAGELALGKLLEDPSGRLAGLRSHLTTYPAALGAALVGGTTWEAGFCLDIATKGAARRDVVYVATCIVRAILLGAHALLAHEGRWALNEKGLMAAAARLPSAPPELEARANDALAHLVHPVDLDSAIRAARVLVDAVRARTC